MANEMLSFFVSLLGAISAWMSTGPMLYLFGFLLGVIVFRMFLLFVRPGSNG